MNFTTQSAIQILERTPVVVETMLRNLDSEWIFANEGGDTWSAFDIIGHYIHGEKTDWLPRMKVILSDNPEKHFAPFDRFAQFRDSQGKSMDELLDEFKRLRQQNVAELRQAELTEEQLNRTGIHPKFGKVTLKQLLATWVVHDLTHIYQISRVMAKQYEIEVGPWKEFLGVLNDR